MRRLPKIMKQERREKLVAVRLNTTEKARIEELAARHELPVSIVIRKSILAGLRTFDEQATGPATAVSGN
jgi:hypothetical protein